jgi:hypothetical protein
MVENTLNNHEHIFIILTQQVIELSPATTHAGHITIYVLDDKTFVDYIALHFMCLSVF